MKQILTILLYFLLMLRFQSPAQTAEDEKLPLEWEAFPIVNYDQDAGVGYGAKGFIFNLFKGEESFDLILFNSTKGERWYKFVFTAPDIQRRHGKEYPAAFDLTIEYDKWINYKLYPSGLASDGSESEIINYTREPVEITALFSRGFTKNFTAEFSSSYKSFSCYGFDNKEYVTHFPSKVEVISLLFILRFDTRDNLINPQSGYVLEAANEIAEDILTKNDQDFYKIRFTGSTYIKLFDPGFVLASRLILQSVSDISYQLMLPLGGSRSIRGLPQDRYLSRSLILTNHEFRFPILWRFGGIAGVDAGNSPATPDWIINSVAGLRFYMDNFVVRFDIGFGKEETGLYFNFGHLF